MQNYLQALQKQKIKEFSYQLQGSLISFSLKVAEWWDQRNLVGVVSESNAADSRGI